VGNPSVTRSTMTHTIDLDAYLQRIGYHATPVANVETLRGLATAHAAAIPFENLDALLGVPVDISSAAVERKLVREGRGGYCFEQNLLFADVLRAVGFEVSELIARVLWTQPEDAITAQTHMLLRVQIGGENWLADVGFGSQTLSGALRLQADIEQPTSLEPFRLIQLDGEWRMQAHIRGQWLTLYRFDLQHHYPIDYVVANHYVSTHPASHFISSLIAARTTTDRRLTLRNREFTIRRLDMEPERRTLRSAAEIRSVLTSEFLLRLPEHAALDQRLDALP